MFWHWKRPAQWTCTVPDISAHFPSLWIKQHHIHTLPFNGPFSGTTRVGQYQKGKTTLDFTEARDSEWQWHQLGHMQVCTSLQTDNHASTPPLSFYRPDALAAAQPTASKHITRVQNDSHSCVPVWNTVATCWNMFWQARSNDGSRMSRLTACKLVCIAADVLCDSVSIVCYSVKRNKESFIENPKFK